MKLRNALLMSGMVAGAAAGATSAYVAMRPKLRRRLRKTGVSKESLALIGHEIKKEATDAAGEVREFLADEAKMLQKGAHKLPRRWWKRKAAEAAEQMEESIDATK